MKHLLRTGGLATLLAASPAWAQSFGIFGQDRVETTLIGVGNYLIRVGQWGFIISIVVAGFFLFSGSPHGTRKALWALGGGLLILLAREILSIMQNLSGNLGILF